jgi:hypothetical protein
MNKRLIDHLTVPCAFIKVAQPLPQSKDGVDLAMIETCKSLLNALRKVYHCKVNSILALMQRLGIPYKMAQGTVK